MILPIALTAAGAAALIHLWLSFRVSQLRRVHTVLIGDGGNEKVRRRMRAHSNYVENAAFFLVLVVLLELAGAQALFLWAAVIAFIVARLLHPFGIDRGDANALRGAGIALSWIVLLGLALWAITLTYLDGGRAQGRLPTASTING